MDIELLFVVVVLAVVATVPCRIIGLCRDQMPRNEGRAVTQDEDGLQGGGTNNSRSAEQQSSNSVSGARQWCPPTDCTFPSPATVDGRLAVTRPRYRALTVRSRRCCGR